MKDANSLKGSKNNSKLSSVSPISAPVSKQIQKKKESAKKISIVEGSMYSVMDGFGLRYIAPFALALGANNAQIAFLSSAPSLFGNVSQLYAHKALSKFSRSTLCFIGSLLQALFFLLIIGVGILYFYGGLSSFWSSTLLVVVYVFLVMFGSFLSPIWSSWMQDVVEKHHLGQYFGLRTRVVSLVLLFCMLAAGFLLDYFKHTHLFLIFALIFFLAMLGRLTSALLFKWQYEPKLKLEQKKYFSFWSFLKNLTKTNFGKFVLAYSLIILATNIASPFFVVYEFKQLSFTYIQYVVLTMVFVLSGVLFVPAWGKFSDRYGNLRTLKICAYLIPLVALFWFLSFLVFRHSPSWVFYYLFIIEGMSGFAWAGFNLATNNFIYDSLDRQQSMLGFAYLGLLAGIGVFIGASLGGLIASFDFIVLSLTPILVVFFISFIARFIAAFVFLHRVKEVRCCASFGLKEAEQKLSHTSPEQMLNYMDLSFVVKELRGVEKFGLEKPVEKMLKTPPDGILKEMKWDFERFSGRRKW